MWNCIRCAARACVCCCMHSFPRVYVFVLFLLTPSSPPSRAWVSLRQEWSSSAVSMDMLTPGVFYGVPNFVDNSSMNAGCGGFPARACSLPPLLLLPRLLCLFSSSQLTWVLCTSSVQRRLLRQPHPRSDSPLQRDRQQYFDRCGRQEYVASHTPLRQTFSKVLCKVAVCTNRKCTRALT